MGNNAGKRRDKVPPTVQSYNKLKSMIDASQINERKTEQIPTSGEMAYDIVQD